VINILVTGSTGFVGTGLIKRLLKDQFPVSAAIRNTSPIKCKDGLDLIPIGNLNASLDWSHALVGVNTVIHLAAIFSESVSSIKSSN